MTQKKDMIKLDGKVYKKQAFIIEDNHPVIGRLLNVEGMKFKILDDDIRGPHKSGTYLAKLTEEDEQRMEEYDNALDELSEKLIQKIDIKTLIKENMKNKSMQEIETGLFILKAKDAGEKVEVEHHKGCYHFKMHYRNQTFEFMTGSDILQEII